MKEMLWSLCPTCAGKGPVRGCLDCRSLRVVESGLTEGQAERLVKEAERVRELEAEVARLQVLTQGLADRVAAQSDLLTRRAKKGGRP